MVAPRAAQSKFSPRAFLLEPRPRASHKLSAARVSRQSWQSGRPSHVPSRPAPANLQVVFPAQRRAARRRRCYVHRHPQRAPRCRPETSIFGIVGCVATGALVTAAAFVADYTRLQDEALDDRQRALEALARTVASSAEQISIAASGLHQIAELAQKNLRHAEKLPHQLQDKMAEFQAQLAAANDAEKEELEKELAALRTSESERLDSVSG